MKHLIPILILFSFQQYSSAQYPLFDQGVQHEIAGCVGELRDGGTRYHYGIDFPASDGTSVYAISTGPLRKLNGAIAVGEFGYIHISPTSVLNALADGTIISSGTKLGEIYTPNYPDHIHLQQASVNIFGSLASTWENGSIWINPLIGLSPFTDIQAPTIDNVRLFRQGTNTDITSNLTLYGKIDVLFNGEDEGINANGTGNSSNNLAPYQTYFSVDNNSGTNLDNHSGIDFSNVPPNSSASSIFHNTANTGNWVTWLTNDPFNSPYNKYWNSRKRNNGSYNTTTDIPIRNKLEGNKIKFNFVSCDISNCASTVLPVNDNVFYTVDNFWPYIKEVKIYDAFSSTLLTTLKRNAYEGTTAENDGYLKNSWSIPAEYVPVEGFVNIRIEIETSEPMENMKVKNALSPLFSWQNMGQIGNDHKKWHCTLNTYYLPKTGCPYDFEFDGKDKNNNKLLDVYHLSDENGDVPVDIPTRVASNGNALDWNNFPSSTLYDRVKLCVNACENGGLVPRSVTMSGCDALRNLEVITSDIPCGGSGSINLSNLNTAEFDYSIFWYDANGAIIDEFNGLAEIPISEPGVYCYKIEYEAGCCSVSDCIEIKELTISGDDVIFSFEDILNEPGKKNLKVTVMNLPEIYNYDITLKLTDENGNVITKTITESDLNIIDFENLIVGKEYCLHIENEDGYCFDHCFTVEGNPCAIQIDAEIINASCPNYNDGAISVSISNLQNGCENFAYTWSTGATASSINNLEPGTYCITVTPIEKDCSGCIVVKCFEVQKIPGVDPIEVNAITRIDCVEEYNEKTKSYTIKWFGFVDMTVSGGTGNYTFKWYPQPINSSNNHNGGVNSYRFQFDQNGPYCVEITDDCGNIYQNCFDDAPIVRKSTDGISLEAAEKKACLGVDREFAEGFYRAFGFSDPKFNIVDLMNLMEQRNYPASLVYSPGLVFVKDYFSLDSVSYNMLVDNQFIMGNVGLRLQSGLPARSSLENIKSDTLLIDRGVVFKAYPNPFSDQLSISVFSNTNIQGMIEVHNIVGQKIYSEKIEVLENRTTNKTLPFNSLSSGIYTISLVSDDKNQNIKVVKVR